MRIGIPMRVVAASMVLAIALVGLVVREGVARAEGQEVRLEMSGYDPRGLLSGRYVSFQLQEQLPPGTACPRSARSIRRPSQWLALKRVGDHHRVVAESASRTEALRAGEIAVRGDLYCRPGAGSPLRSVRGGETEPTLVTLNLGIDRLHVDQAQAVTLERDLRRLGEPPTRRDYAVVSVGRDGKARLKGVIVAGRRIDLTWF